LDDNHIWVFSCYNLPSGQLFSCLYCYVFDDPVVCIKSKSSTFIMGFSLPRSTAIDLRSDFNSVF